jgi:hypothetical protein
LQFRKSHEIQAVILGNQTHRNDTSEILILHHPASQKPSVRICVQGCHRGPFLSLVLVLDVLTSGHSFTWTPPPCVVGPPTGMGENIISHHTIVGRVSHCTSRKPLPTHVPWSVCYVIACCEGINLHNHLFSYEQRYCCACQFHLHQDPNKFVHVQNTSCKDAY